MAAGLFLVPVALYAFDEDINRSVEAGMNAHLIKPVDSEQLVRILEELVYEAENCSKK